MFFHAWIDRDQSMHEKTSVASLIAELYTFLRQADARELGDLYRQLDKADDSSKSEFQNKIDNFQTHVVPIIADIDAGFGNEEATYLMAKQMIEAGACAIQIENQVSDEKQCGHHGDHIVFHLILGFLSVLRMHLLQSFVSPLNKLLLHYQSLHRYLQLLGQHVFGSYQFYSEIQI